MDKITNYILNENKQLQEQEITPASVIEAAENAGQIGAAKNIVGSGLDVDTLTTPGKYYINGTGTYVNLPTGVTLGYLTVHYVTSDGPVQQILVTHTSRVYIRAKTTASGPWSAWTEMAKADDIPAVPGVMTGASASQAGTQGLVPAPTAGKQGSYLMGDATWGRDADVLAAIGAGQIGAAKNIVGSGLDVDTLTTPGKYYINGTGTYVNLPTGVTLGYLTVHYVTSDGPVQQILVTHTSRVYIRAKTTASGPWSAWTEMAKADDIPAVPGVMTGASASQAGKQGIVPAPAAGKQSSYLMGDATWGRDADVLAAIEAGQIGAAKNIVGNNLDIDTLTTPGKYYINGTGTYVNLPPGVTLGYLTVHYVTSDGPVQQILVTHTSRVYIRAKTTASGPWSAWTEMAKADDIPAVPGVMTGASASQAGKQGIVPAPAAGKQSSYLMGDATWGRDADVLAAIEAGQIGAAKNIVGNNLDIDTLTTPGKYYINGTGTYVNLPPGVTLGYLTVHYVTSDGPVQQILVTHTSRVYIRAKTTASDPWSAWTEMAKADDIPAVPGVMTGASASQAGKQGIVPAPAAGKQSSYLMGDATWGRDADVLAAIEAGQIGAAKNIVGNNLDIDTLTTPGKYYINGTGTYVNLPPGVTLGYLTVHYVTSDGPVQQILVTHTSRVYIRAKTTASDPWSAWTEMAKADDIPAVPGVMTGASASQAGKQGIVPAPAAGKQSSYLMGDATWGRDADVLAAIEAGQIGAAKNIVGNNLDIDTLTTPGKYYINGTGTYVNLPPGVTLGYLTVHYVTSDGPVQQILVTHTSRVYIRAKTTASDPWSAWTELASVGSCAPMPTTASGVGRWQSYYIRTSNDHFTLPAGGTWAYMILHVIGYGSNEYIPGAFYIDIAAGGTTIEATSFAENFPDSFTTGWTGLFWRLA